MNLYDDVKMDFGPHKDKCMADIPADYLLQLYYADNLMGLPRMYVATNLETLKQKAKQTSPQND